MIRLIYFSTAHADLTRADVDGIVTHAAKWNAAHDVSGALAYNGRNFCQCLEGDEPVVRKLVDSIGADPRHSGLKVIDEKTVESRYFSDWSMQLVDGLNFSAVIDAMKA